MPRREARSSGSNSPLRVPLAQACAAAFETLCRSPNWQAQIDQKKVSLIADFGPGTGDKTAMWWKYLKGEETAPNILLVDLSKPMLREACKPLAKIIESPVQLAALRAEFERLSDYRALLPSRIITPEGRAIVLYLGQTAGNIGLAPSVVLAARNLRPGDLWVIGLELSRTRNGFVTNAEAVSKELYDNEETRAVWARGARVVTAGGSITKPRIEHHDKETFSVRGFHVDTRGRETCVFVSTRYSEERVVQAFSEARLRLVADAGAPLRPAYKLLVFEKL
ncbi:MAG: L-histidine N(alpha)-methyltransferase [Rhizomicrobium sp.]